jgi:hypothetical protein
MPLEPPDQQHWQAAVGYVELGMFQDANDQLEKIDPFNRDGRAIFVADAHRGDGKRFIVRADEMLTAFVELESAVRAAANCLD